MHSNQPLPDRSESPSLPHAGELVRHGTHLIDLLLAARPEAAMQYGKLMRELVAHIQAGVVPIVNEKFDGSPAIVIGFNQAGKPFLAYKGGFARKGQQALISTPEDVQRFYRDDSPLGKVLADVSKKILPALEGAPHRDLLFQGDLLFTAGGGQRTIGGQGEIAIRANPYGITYQLKPDHALYQQVREASVGLVLHSIAERNVVADRVNSSPSTRESSYLLDQVATLQSSDLFVLDPFRRDVLVGERAGAPLSLHEARIFLSRIDTIVSRVSELTPQFVEAWKVIAPKFATYLNSRLYPPHTGGLYRAAADRELFDGEKLLNGFVSWISLRQGGGGTGVAGSESDRPTPRGFVAKTLDPFIAAHRDAFMTLTGAYYEAAKVQAELKHYMASVYQSKLGGGPAEGVMFGSVKLVDRLAFTLGNFKGTAERQSLRAKGQFNRPGETVLPAPFDRWRSDVIYYLGKFQPLHAGHVEVIRCLQAENPGKRIIVLASDKEPNLRAKEWKDLGVGERKRDLARGEYTYLFSKRFRGQLFKAAFGDSVEVKFLSPSYFWEYLRRAKREGMPGSIQLALGEKELAEDRYQDQFLLYERHLRPCVIPAKQAGLSATAVRAALKKGADDEAAASTLEQGFSYIADPIQRQKLVEQALRAHGKADAAVRRVLQTKPKKRA